MNKMELVRIDGRSRLGRQGNRTMLRLFPDLGWMRFDKRSAVVKSADWAWRVISLMTLREGRRSYD